MAALAALMRLVSETLGSLGALQARQRVTIAVSPFDQVLVLHDQVFDLGAEMIDLRSIWRRRACSF